MKKKTMVSEIEELVRSIHEFAYEIEESDSLRMAAFVCIAAAIAAGLDEQDYNDFLTLLEKARIRKKRLEENVHD